MPKTTEASPPSPSSHLCLVPGRRVKAPTICMMPVTIAQAAIRKSRAKAVMPGQNAQDPFSAQAYFLVAPTFAAAWISSNTSSGWETIEAWLDRTEMVVAFMRLANTCCRDGGMTRSFFGIRYHEGLVFHATAVAGSAKWATLPGFCTVAMMLA